jgi:hypothetical protein
VAGVSVDSLDVSDAARVLFDEVQRSAPISVIQLEAAVGHPCRDLLDELVMEALVDDSGGEVRLTLWGGAVVETMQRTGGGRDR